MTRPALEVADVVRQYGAAYLARYGSTLSPEQHRALRAIAVCRTAALGGHATQCDQCGHLEITYNSCGNRHCPKCPGRAQAAWLAAREAELLDVPYVHVVFTLPHLLSPLALQNPRVLYTLLFQAVAETLLTGARDPHHLGADIGFLAVLHTWGQTLHHHPHLHCVVPGGGLSPDGTQWRACRPTFFLPVRVLSRVFRRLFLAGLQQTYTAGALTFEWRCHPLTAPARWQQFLSPLRATEWVVYAKPPVGGPGPVLKYLARYTHRVAIANRRLLALGSSPKCAVKSLSVHFRLFSTRFAALLCHLLFIRRLTLLLFLPSADCQLTRAPSGAWSGSNRCCSVRSPATRPCS
jgi:Putative transposase/Transposase zinc-binding domain